MKLLRIAKLLCFCLSFCIASAQVKTSKYSQVKIFIPKTQLAGLQAQGLDVDHVYYNHDEQSFTTTLESREIAKLRQMGVRYQVTIDDEEQDFLRRNDPKDFFKYDQSRKTGNATGKLLFNSPDRSFANTIVTPAAFNQGSMGGYLTFAEMKKELDSMVMNYPSLVKLDSIGRTHENRAIWALTISDNAAVNENEPEILYTGMHHAREPLGMMNLIFFMQYLLENYSTNARIKEIVDNREMVFIPCLNPDGYVYNQSTNPTGGGMWRKNRQPNGDGSIGQDLNRNYGYGFDYPNSGSSDVSTADNYHGDFAFQGRESDLMRLYLRTRDFKYAINYHSYGGYWIHGYCVPTGTLTPTDTAIINMTGSLATKHNFYEVGTPLETVGYNANGSSDDWFMGGDAGVRPPVYAISPEVGLGLGTFWPSASTIIGYCKEVFYSNLQAALFAGSYVDMDDRTNMALTSTTGNLDFYVTQIGRVDSPVRISVFPLENVVSLGAPVSVASIPAYMGHATLSVPYTLHPAITAGQRVRYIVRTESGGVSRLDTMVRFYNPITVFTDDMEGSTVGSKWTVSSGWNYSTVSANSGTKSLSESPSGNYGNGATLTASTGNLDLSNATSAYLSFWIRYKTQPGFDKLQVKVSTNGGSTYTALPGTHTVTENIGTIGGIPSFTGYQYYWVRETINLSSAIGSSTVRIRFEFTSNASAIDDGFFIDDVQVTKSTAIFVTLPVRFIDVKAVKADDKTMIRWEADIDDSHERFEIERSTDGVNFVTIATTTDRNPVNFATDHSPVAGMNYYRIKAVGKGGVHYSKTVSVQYSKSSLVKLYPNPVRDQLNLQVNGLTAGKYQIQIITVNGQVASYKEVEVSNPNQLITVNTDGINRGNYQICVRKESGDLVEVKSFLKL